MVESDSDVGIRIVKEGRRWFKWEAQWGFVGVGAGEVVGWRSSAEGSPQFPTTLKCKSLAAVCEQQKRLVMGDGTLVGGTGTLQSIGTSAVHIRVPQSVVLYYLFALSRVLAVASTRPRCSKSTYYIHPMPEGTITWGTQTWGCHFRLPPTSPSDFLGEFHFMIKERPGPLRCTSCHIQK